MADRDAADNAEPAQTPARVPAQLSMPARVIGSILGGGIIGLGIWAVFAVDRDWGPVAVVIVGSVLLLTGLVGRLPYLKWGDKEIDYSGPLAQAVKTLESSPEDLPKNLEELAKTVPPSLAPEVRKLANAAEMMNLIRDSLPEGVSISDGVGAGYLRSDSTLIGPNGSKVLVVIRRSVAVDQRDFFKHALDELKGLDSSIVGGVVIYTRAIPAHLKYDIERYGWTPYRYQQSRDEEQATEGLQRAIEKAFAELEH